MTKNERSNSWHRRNVKDLEERLVWNYLCGAKQTIEEGGTPFKLSDKEFFNDIFIPGQIEMGIENRNAKGKRGAIGEYVYPEHKLYIWDRISHKRICHQAIHRVKSSPRWECVAKFRGIETNYKGFPEFY